MPLVQKLRGGFDLVMGTRMKGTILPGAMSWKSRYIGNPILTATGRVLFRAPFSDFHCGLRGFTKASYVTLGVRTTGFEFTTEHIVKYTCRQLKLAEVPISVHPAGRDRPPHPEALAGRVADAAVHAAVVASVDAVSAWGSTAGVGFGAWGGSAAWGSRLGQVRLGRMH